MSSKEISWQLATFEQLTTKELYQMLQLRIEIFVVEQTCYYQDLDGKDHHRETQHLMGYRNNELVAYARLLAPGVSYDGLVSIGRVIVAPQGRGMKLGAELMIQAIAGCEKYWPDHNIKLSAQQHLQEFYQRQQFKTVSEMYLEDDIPHVAMVREIT